MATDESFRVRPSTQPGARARTNRSDTRPRTDAGSKRVARAAAGHAQADQSWLRVATIAVTTAAVVVLAGGGYAFWLCLPAVLLVSALARTPTTSFISAAGVTAAAALPLTGWLHVGRLPEPGLTLLVVAASVTVLVAMRERLERT